MACLTDQCRAIGPRVHVLRFVESASDAVRLVVDVSENTQRWSDLCALGTTEVNQPVTQRAVRLFYALLAIHQYVTGQDSKDAYVPFRPQLFSQGKASHSLCICLLMAFLESC
ncbi:hypothetical protein GCM10027395_13330 [Giesbergeria sinuosa]